MKSFFTLSLSLVLTTLCSAQITITDDDMPHAGDQLYRTRAVNNPFVDYATTGAAHVWDFSDLSAQEQDTADYLNVSSTNFVYAIAFADIFFNPNRANHAQYGVDIAFNALLPIDDPYSFYYRTSSQYKRVGYGVGLAGLPVPIIFEDHDVMYELPLNFGDASADHSSWNVGLPTLFYYGYEQDRENEVDGWGALTIPSGSFEVLRVKTTINGKDTINLDSLGIGFAIERPTIREYKWLASGQRMPVLQINTAEVFGFELVTDIFFYDVPRSLEVISPLAQTLCPGSQVDVHYEAEGIYNEGGFFIPANDFIAQLSDVNGDFTNAVDIGSIEATTSGVIDATIPANTPLGTGYRIRVISTSPDYIGLDNGFDITISDAAPVASISAGGTTEFCEGGSVTLIASPNSGVEYQWQLDGADIPGATDGEFLADAPGDYTVGVSNGCGSDASDVISVTVGDAPEHVLNGTTFISCDGSLPTILAENTSGQSDLIYQWYLNGAEVTGEIGAEIVAGEVGDYYLLVTNTVTGCEFTTETATFILDEVTTPQVTADGNTLFCPGGSVGLSVDPVDGLTYQWYMDGVAINGATDTTLLVSEAGDYTVIGTSMNSCSSEPSAAITVTVGEIPQAPDLGADVSFCAGDGVTLDAGMPGLIYQWTLNGVDIPGEISQTLTVTAAGSYSVVVTNNDGCSATAANPVNVTMNEAPQAPELGPDVSFCEGDAVTLDAGISGSTYQWTLNGVDIPGETSQTLTVTASGAYNVVITNNDGCSATAANPVIVTVNPLPEVPVISESNGVLSATSGSTFQWYLNGNAITDADSSSYEPMESGDYSVSVTDVNGCTSTSDPYAFIWTSVTELSSGGITVFPNPSNGVFTLDVTAQGSTSYEIVDATGKVIARDVLIASRTTIDLSGNGAGVYALRLTGHGSMSTIRVVVQ